MLVSPFARCVTPTALALIVVVLAVHPTWARALGADVWNVSELRAELRAEENEGERLEAEAEAMLHRIAVKEGVVVELLAGRITLAEAVKRFTVLTESRPAHMARVLAIFPGATDAEKMARSVIEYTLPRVAIHKRDATASRLEAELERMVAAGACN